MAKHRRYVPSIGTISHGTLRDEDLIDSFYDELVAAAPRGYGKLKRDCRRYFNSVEDSPIRDDGSHRAESNVKAKGVQS